MQIFSCCHRRVWEIRLSAEGELARGWVRRELGELTELEAGPGLWRYEGATSPHPLLAVLGEVEHRGVIDLRLRAEGELAEATCRFEDLEATVRNRPRALPVQVEAGVAEHVHTVELDGTYQVALRWFLAWRQLGCVNLEAYAFLGRRTEACAYLVPDAARWLAAGAPLPLDARLEDVGIFVMLEGADLEPELVQRLDDRLIRNPRLVDFTLGRGESDEPGARAWLAVGTVTGGAGDGSASGDGRSLPPRADRAIMPRPERTAKWPARSRAAQVHTLGGRPASGGLVARFERPRQQA